MYIKSVLFNANFVNIFRNLFVYSEKYGYIGRFKRPNVKKLTELNSRWLILTENSLSYWTNWLERYR